MEETKEEQIIEQPKSNQLSIRDVDAHWIKRKLEETIDDKDIIKYEQEILTILGAEISIRECEKKLFTLLSHKNLELVRILVKSRHTIFYGIILKQAQTDNEKEEIENQMKESLAGRQLLIELSTEEDILKKAERSIQSVLDKKETAVKLGSKITKQPPKAIDLDLLKFQQGSRLMANKKCTLPKGSTRLTKQGYEEVYVPAIRQKKSENEKLVSISSLPQWARCAFPSYMTHLNRIQSKLYKAAFSSPQNLLVCAPTGAGKTNIAMLACLQLLGEMRTQTGGKTSYNLSQFKIIYIAPMKALVSEVVGNFQARLGSFGIKVKELTGDTHLSRQQIEEANIIVTTPEKWDIITRKAGDRAYVDLVKLIIIDEVHLLHDSRGPVLEAIIARTIRQIEETAEMVRIVGLSATLPNYQDVAALLRVDPTEGLHYFDNTYRPVPLEQIYVGITEKKAIKRVMVQNEICYEKVMERAGKHQVLVFAHSRKETARTAKIIRDMALAQDKLGVFVKEDSESKKILLDVIVQKKLAVSKDVQDLVPYGIGIHHAGLSKEDRSLVEDLFAAGHLQVLVSTATLAWGVNLPAHTVIIKGTQIYSPEQGKWVELSPQDILQMMGRAGRPQYDTLGEGIIITNHSDLQYYLSLNNQQLPIESQMIQSLSDQLNAEIVLGSVLNLQEAVTWLSYSYLYIRMRRNPDLYGVNPEDTINDPMFVQTRINLVHSAAIRLQKAGMIKYEKKSGSFVATSLGKVASHYYIKCDSMQVYNEELKPNMSMIDLFRLFALSKEFENIPIRENEKVELTKFIDRVPIPVKGGTEESSSKINILLQAYIARFKLEGYDLNSDMVYVTQSASRIMRALFEISLKKGWAQLAENLLNICKMVEKRQWYSMTPLRQFASILDQQGINSQDLYEIARKIERKEQFKWNDFLDLSAQRIGELIKSPKMGKLILSYVYKFPRLEISAFVQPITRSTVRIELELKTHEKFDWDSKFHGWAESFWILVEDGDSEQILHYEQFILRECQVGVDHHLSFTVPLFDPLPPQYFVKVFSDKWLQSEHVIPISFKNLILPEKFAAPTQLLDMHGKIISDLNFEEAAQIYKNDRVREFSPIQTQAFDKVYKSDDSLFFGVPNGGAEKRTLAEMAIFREIQKENFGKIVYISPKIEFVKNLYKNWNDRLGEDGLGLDVEMLTDDYNTQVNDYQVLQKCDIMICTPEKWDFLSRKWRQKKVIQEVSLIIFDNLHLFGSVYEIIMSRTRQIQSELENQKIRIIGISTPLANSKDVCDWLGVSFPESCFNFHPNIRASCPSIGPLQVNIQAYDHNTKHHRILQMIKPTYQILKRHKDQTVIFVSQRKLTSQCALEILNMCSSDGNPQRFLGKETQINTQISYSEELLPQALECGVAYLHEGLSQTEVEYIKDLFKKRVVRVLIATNQFCWNISDLQASQVIIQDPERYSSQERRHQELPLADLLQIQSLAISDSVSKCIIMCHTPKKDFYAKFISEPLPIESDLAHNLHDHLSAEVVSGTIESIQDAIDWITWTLMYRRISKNPNYYEIAGKTGQHINDFLSELIEDTVADLAEAGCITVKENEMDVEPANIGRIASFYYIKYQTIETFAKSLLVEGVKMKQLLEILSQSTEFEQILETRETDESIMRQLALNLPIDIPSSSDFSEAHIQSNIFIQCYLSRKPVPVDLKADQTAIISESIRLTHAMVDVISSGSSSNLRPAIMCMELSQMIVQALWMNQSPLLQLPFMSSSMIENLKSAKVLDIADFMNMEDDTREKYVPLPEQKMMKLATVCNRYPNLELVIEGQEGDEVTLTARRDIDEGDFETKEEYLEELKTFASPVDAPYYPNKKEENWWLVIGGNNKILGIKKITNLNKKPSITISMAWEKGAKAYLICDSYMGCDLEKKL